MEIREDLDIGTEDFWYDLTDGGYLDPYEICKDEVDAARVEDAIAVLKEFYDSCVSQIEDFIL